MHSFILWLLWLSQIFPLDISRVKPFQWKVVTYSVVSSWLSRKETGSVCSILKLSSCSLAFKSCSESEETSPLFPKLLANFQQFSNIYHICWPCIFFYHPLQYSQVCLGSCIVTDICNILECSVTFVARRAILTCTNRN